MNVGVLSFWWRAGGVLLMGLATSGAIAQRPLTNPDTWITSEDYPADMPSTGGRANVEFDISAEGRVNSCRGRETSPPQLTSIVCGLLEERARYEPAYDSDGRAVASQGLHSVSWVERGQGLELERTLSYGGALPRNNPGSWITYMDVPEAQLRRGGSGSVLLTFDITVEGRASNCTGDAAGAHPSLVPHFCRVLERRARFRPPTGRDGLPYATSGQIEAGWSVGR